MVSTQSTKINNLITLFAFCLFFLCSHSDKVFFFLSFTFLLLSLPPLVLSSAVSLKGLLVMSTQISWRSAAASAGLTFLLPVIYIREEAHGGFSWQRRWRRRRRRGGLE